MIRSVFKSFKVPDVEVVAARMSNESELTRMTDSIQKTLVRLDAGPGPGVVCVYVDCVE